MHVNCHNFEELHDAIKLPITSFSVREKVQAIQRCTQYCGSVKTSCTTIIGKKLEAEKENSLENIGTI